MGHANDVNLPGYNIDSIKEKHKIFNYASKDVGLDMKAVKYVLLCRHQNAAQNHDTENRSLEIVAQFLCLEPTVTDQNLIKEEVKTRLNSGNAYYSSVQNLLSTAAQKLNNYIIQDYDFACDSVWV
jgi:hypothetical protein